MRAAIIVLLGLSTLDCGDKQGPKPSPALDKRGIQDRSDQVHDDLKEEEERAKRRKEE